MTPEKTAAEAFRSRAAFALEFLESRTLLSAASSITIVPNIEMAPQASISGFQGYSPQQIKSAYGFSNISFGNITGDGSGQTIAIVDAYNDPNILADLHVFDQKFSISDPPSFKQVSQTGGSTSSITTDAGWAGEISLDVESAHAIAPKANILLVEAKSANLGDLLSAVDYARNAAGVSVVSMSWGAGEFSSQTACDQYFTTPAGHQGVTFVASSGDQGSWWGPEWPATSPNVLSVGGTSLNIGSTGAIRTETGWSASTGGFSEYEIEPSYQQSVQNTGVRTSPDVSYDANPYTGFAVYDSVPYQGYSGWMIAGGTSAGAPQWGALIAIANQGRSINGQASLDGAKQTIPALYQLANSATTYAADYNDITMGSSSWFVGALTGYDLMTGLGSPHADKIVQGLIGSSSTSSKTTITTTTHKTHTRARQSVVETPLPEPISTAPKSALPVVMQPALTTSLPLDNSVAQVTLHGVNPFGKFSIAGTAPIATASPTSTGASLSGVFSEMHLTGWYGGAAPRSSALS